MRAPKKWFGGGSTVLEPVEPEVVIPVEPDPEPEVVDVPMTELHPAAVLVCFSHYFNMRDNELPPHIQQTMLRDGKIFISTWDSQKREIVLHVKEGSIDKSVLIEVKRFPLAAFDRLYIEVAG